MSAPDYEGLAERLEAVESSRKFGVTTAVTTHWYRNPDGPEASAAIRHLVAERDRLEEALTPSGDTKAAYHGEFKFQVTQWRENEDPDSDEEMEAYLADFTVPWTTVKEIMAALKARAALSGRKEP